MKKILLALALAASILLCGCSSEAEKANYNISKQADYFESERKITVYNARTDKVIMEAEGYMSISNNSNNELVCTVKVGPDSYRKNYIYLNDYTMYVVEDITGTHTDPYHYKLYFHTDILPSVEGKPEKAFTKMPCFSHYASRKGSIVVFSCRIRSAGRAPVSKTGCRRFESCIRCHRGGQRVPCPGSMRKANRVTKPNGSICLY